MTGQRSWCGPGGGVTHSLHGLVDAQKGGSSQNRLGIAGTSQDGDEMRSRLTTVVAAAAVLVPIGIPAQAAGSLPDRMPGDRLIVTEHAAGTFALALYERDGSGRLQLTDGEADFAPVWSPDGQRIAFHRVSPAAIDVWTVGADGTGAGLLAENAFSPSWSPDGSEIVFSTAFEGKTGPLRIAAADGSGDRAVATTGNAIDPAWSPDGGLLAFVAPAGEASEVRVVRPDGTGARVLSSGGRNPSWSPDGTWLAVVEGDGTEDGTSGTDELVLLRRDGEERRVVVTGFRRIAQAEWSPSGRGLAFSGIRTAGASHDIWTVDSGGGDLMQRTETADDDLSPGWSASGRHIGFTRTPDIFQSAVRNAWALEAGTGSKEQVTDDDRSGMAGFGPGRGLRVFGAERIATAASLSHAVGGTGPVVVARADDYPDALAGAALAAAVDGPVLLTGSGGLHPLTEAEVRRRAARTAYLLGGTAALSEQVEADLVAAGVEEVVRLAGHDRFATAARVAETVSTLVGGLEAAYVVEGAHADPDRGWPDAVSASGLSAFTGRPVLLVTAERLPGATAQALEALGVGRVAIVGGAASVSPAVEEEIAARGIDTERLAGATRFETGLAVVQAAEAAGADGARPWLATGRNWPDALAAGAAAARDGGVLALVDGHDLAGSPSMRDWLAEKACGDRTVYVGGVAVVQPLLVAQAEAATTC